MRIIDEATQPPLQARILEVHVALDLETSSTSDAGALQRHVEEHLLPAARPTNAVTRRSGTTYYNFKTRRGAEVVLYSDRVGKVHKRPALHIEWRTKGAQALRANGLGSAEQLVGLDFENFWRKRLKMYTPLAEKALVLARRKASKRKGEPTGSWQAQVAQLRHMVRLLRGWHGGIAAHDLLLHLSKDRRYQTRPKRLFQREKTTWMLPGSCNDLWTTYEGSTK